MSPDLPAEILGACFWKGWVHCLPLLLTIGLLVNLILLPCTAVGRFHSCKPFLKKLCHNIANTLFKNYMPPFHAQGDV